MPPMDVAGGAWSLAFACVTFENSARHREAGGGPCGTHYYFYIREAIGTDDVFFSLTVSSGWVMIRLIIPAVADPMTSWRSGDDRDEDDDDDDVEGEVSSELISRVIGR